MTTAETVLVIILIALLIIFFILCIAIVAMTLKILAIVRRIVEKAEEVADSVGSAAEVLRDTQGRLALFKLIRNIVKLAQKKGKK
jgi:predicted Holliday junction resolvase-like endonuclease